MAITDFTTYKSLISAPSQIIHKVKAFSSSTQTGGLLSSWMQVPDPAPSAPTTAAVPSGTLVNGGFGQSDGTNQRISKITTGVQVFMGLILCDRLSHQGGLSGTTTGAQTTNLDTAALTRYTNGVGVWAGLEIYTSVGSTATTCTVTYTNTAGGSSTSPAIPFGGTGYNTAGRIIPVPLSSGDVGVKSVQNVNLTASTLTAGNFGVTLFKPLLWLPYSPMYQQMSTDALLGMGGMMPTIENSACLFWVCFPSVNGVGVGTVNAELIFTEDA